MGLCQCARLQNNKKASFVHRLSNKMLPRCLTSVKSDHPSSMLTTFLCRRCRLPSTLIPSTFPSILQVICVWRVLQPEIFTATSMGKDSMHYLKVNISPTSTQELHVKRGTVCAKNHAGWPRRCG